MARKRIEQKVKKLVRSYIQLLQRDHLPIKNVFVFGSRTTGRFHKDSDIDVAVVSSKLGNSLAATKYLLSKAHQLDNNELYIEPHAFHPTAFVDENPVVWQIKHEGIKID